MKALQSLTELFIRHVADEKHIELWAEDGELRCTQGSSIDGFDLAYTVNINMSDVAVEPQTVMMHLVNWLNTYDCDRESKGLAAPTFATQMLDKGRFDITIKVDIEESYGLTESALGMWERDGTRYECGSEFVQAVSEEELDILLYVGGHEDDLS